MLWLELKHRRFGGHKFTRQFPIGPYFADFACRERCLIVELDGSQHADSPYARARDAFINLQGWSLLPFWSHDVLRHRRPVCDTILTVLDGRLQERVESSDLRFTPAAD